MDFVAIDFETANSNRSSACSMGIAIVYNGEVAQKKSWLIKPEPLSFDPWNVRIHGITEHHVKDKPNFKECWDEIKGYLDNKLIVAHNASFDISVLRNTLDYYNLRYPNFRYICSYKVAMKTWDNIVNYRLDTIAKMLDIKFSHHDALEDSVTCAYVLLRSLDYHECNDVNILANKLEITLGELFRYEYTPCSTSYPTRYRLERSKPSSIKDITPTVNTIDESSIFFNKKVVFTGTMLYMTRTEAMQKVRNCGGNLGENVSRDTDFLVMGIQDYKLFADGMESSKTKKAKKLIANGQMLQIIDEETFMNYL